MARVRDQAICIRHLDWSETSQVVVLLTREHGKVRGIAKGSRRLTPSSVQRFSGGVELLTRGEIVMVLRPLSHPGASELATLTEWDLQDDHHHLRTDLRAQQLAMYAADVCNALLADLDPHPGSFEAMAALLRGLDERDDSAKSQAALLRFQWAMLVDAGYRPELWRDAVTGEPLADEAGPLIFDPQAGGLTRQTRPGAADWRVRPATIAALRAVAQEIDVGETESGPTGGEGNAAAALTTDAGERANRLLCVYFRTILDRELPTMPIVLG